MQKLAIKTDVSSYYNYNLNHIYRVYLSSETQCKLMLFLSREREALAAENDARYHALKMRWKELIESYQPPVDPEVPESIPLYLRECQACNASNSQTNTERNQVSGTTAEQKASQVGEDQLVFLNLTAKVC